MWLRRRRRGRSSRTLGPRRHRRPPLAWCGSHFWQHSTGPLCAVDFAGLRAVTYPPAHLIKHNSYSYYLDRANKTPREMPTTRTRTRVRVVTVEVRTRVSILPCLFEASA